MNQIDVWIIVEVYELNSSVNCLQKDDWTAELVDTANNYKFDLVPKFGLQSVWFVNILASTSF